MRPDPRERRTLAIAATVAAVALLSAFVVAPTAARWRDREHAIAATRDRVARLRGLIAHPVPAIAADTRDEVHVVRGRTASLAAATLHGLLQDLARRSSVSVTQLDVSAGDSTTQLLNASLSATTDIYGAADLITRLQTASLALAVTELSIVPNPVLRGNLLQMSVTVRAPWLEGP